MLQAVTDALKVVIQWIQIVVNSLIGSGETAGQLSALLPLFAIGIAISAFLLGIKAIKSLIWGS